MKKATMQYLVDLMNYRIHQNGGEAKTDTVYVTVRDELTAELNKGAEQKQKNADAYESIHDLVVGNLSNAPCTCAELYEAIKDKLPDGMGKGKVQYALTHLWQNEIVKIEGKPNTYRRA